LHCAHLQKAKATLGKVMLATSLDGVREGCVTLYGLYHMMLERRAE